MYIYNSMNSYIAITIKNISILVHRSCVSHLRTLNRHYFSWWSKDKRRMKIVCPLSNCYCDFRCHWRTFNNHLLSPIILREGWKLSGEPPACQRKQGRMEEKTEFTFLWKLSEVLLNDERLMKAAEVKKKKKS